MKAAATCFVLWRHMPP